MKSASPFVPLNLRKLSFALLSGGTVGDVWFDEEALAEKKRKAAAKKTKAAKAKESASRD